MQKRFIADAAHQMKTPLAGMRMQSELALRQTRSGRDPPLARAAGQELGIGHAPGQPAAGAGARRKPAARRRRFEQLDLGELARGVVQDWVQASFAHEIDLGFEQTAGRCRSSGNRADAARAAVEPDRQRAALHAAGGSVTVRVRSNAPQLAMLEVEDTGPGIAPAERRACSSASTASSAAHPGSGLGLAIVREIAQQHGAEIDIFNNPRSRRPKCRAACSASACRC
jgi:two-component system sensor histidine kinase TctE